MQGTVFLPIVVSHCSSWHNHLNPDIKKTPWTDDEDRTILNLYQQFGSKWAEMAKFLPGRLCCIPSIRDCQDGQCHQEPLEQYHAPPRLA
jgi:hypothetical protein